MKTLPHNNHRFSDNYLSQDLEHNYYQDNYIQENPAAISAGAAVFNILTSAVTSTTKGDLSVSWPSGPVGVTVSGIPANISSQLRAVSKKRTIFKYKMSNPITGIKQVNIQLTCALQYNGPSVQATFGFAAGGTRSRLLRDTKISIRNPLSLEKQPTNSDWKKAGIHTYPVVTIPIEISIDQPWPQSNDHWTFDLIISGMHGFGRRKGERFIKNWRHIEN